MIGDLVCRNIDQSCARTVGHGYPRMSTDGTRHDIYRLARYAIPSFFVFDGPAGFHIDSGCPGNRHDRLGGDQGTSLSVEHVKEAILVGLHYDLATSALNIQIGQYELLNSVIVPFVSWCGLVVPDISARVSVQSHDRSDV